MRRRQRLEKMAGTSKILTVSYGAFSCTLEGFDDPIAKMREVAEYYREMSARDPKFGALPAPDAQQQQALIDARAANHIEARPGTELPVLNRQTSGVTETSSKLDRLRSVAPSEPLVAEVVDVAPVVGKPISTAFADITPVEDTVAAAPAPVAQEPVAPQPVAEPEPVVAVQTVIEPEPVAAPASLYSGPLVPPTDGDEVSIRDAIRGNAPPDIVAEAPAPVIEAEASEIVPEPSKVVDIAPARGGLLSRLKGRFTGEVRAKATLAPVTTAPPGPPVSKDPIVEKAEPDAPAGLDPVEAALAQIVAQEQKMDRIERRQVSTETAQSDSVERIFARTDSVLGEDDNSRRRSTISQLKAAVAVTRAGGTEGEDDEEKSMSRFRADLEQVVRPEKPAEPARPAAGRRMAPLMLVSDQRIDVPASDGIAARRTSGNLALAEDDESEAGDEIFVDTTPFIEYAASQQINGIEEMAEAAAAFSIYVLGQPHFSRSQLEQFVESAMDPGEFSGEAVKRAFGTLLRLGRVSKVKRGLFNLAPGSRFEP
jgi:hypothetical protein